MHMKVLIAEDDNLLLSILVRTLGNGGLEVRGARDGFEAEVEVKSWHPDVVLLDLLMPNEDGFGVLRKIRADDEVSKTRVIVLSNLSAPDTMAEVKKFGVTEYLLKSDVTPQDIVKMLKGDQ